MVEERFLGFFIFLRPDSAMSFLECSRLALVSQVPPQLLAPSLLNRTGWGKRIQRAKVRKLLDQMKYSVIGK